MHHSKTTKLETIRAKIIAGDVLQKKLNTWRFQDKKIVFTNGCFDLLHYGHVEYLAKAKELGDVLVVGLNSDASVKKLKGDSRPIQDENSRAMILASLESVDGVIIFDEDTPYNLISLVLPAVLVVPFAPELMIWNYVV